jgi:hypothetical protein
LFCNWRNFHHDNQSNSKIGSTTKVLEEIPVVNFNDTEANNAQEKAIRSIRAEKYNTGNPLKDIFTRPQADLLELPLGHAPVKPAFPVSQSDAILIGSITDSQAFLSTDKSYVYSEFIVQVEDVLKNFSSAALAPNTTTTIERAGGIVRFASGKTLQLGNFGEGFPVKQGRYLLFLKWSESGKDFLILTGYKLDGKVTPLDGTVKNADIKIFKNYKTYENNEESSFLKAVKTAIENPLEEVTAK